MVDSVSLFILAERWVTIEDISEQIRISVGTVHKIMDDDFAFSKVSCYWVPKKMMPECKALYNSKNSENHQPVWLGIAASSSLKSTSDPFLFLLVWNFFSKFQAIMNKEQSEEMAEDSVQRFLCWKNTKAYFLLRKMWMIFIQ